MIICSFENLKRIWLLGLPSPRKQKYFNIFAKPTHLNHDIFEIEDYLGIRKVFLWEKYFYEKIDYKYYLHDIVSNMAIWTECACVA